MAPRQPEVRDAVAKTDLPEEATVRPTQSSAESHAAERGREHDRNADKATASLDLDRRVDVDPSTDSYVYRAVDTQSGEVVTQVPDDSMLKLRAYVESMETVANQHVAEEGRAEAVDEVA
ncbi:MAG: hypothetical protein C0606_12190 [Hyphomicrobiales bacterium]|nr:MAG: hypothetical protein C0606_12190 [Hyphomicrobiales bacterium]